MSCNCNGICTQACAKGAVEPEELVIEFENKRGDLFSIFMGINGDWIIMSDKEGMIHARFKLLEQAKKCAEALKESV